MSKLTAAARWALILAMAGTVPGCVAAAAAAAGGATGVYLTSRGAKSLSPMPLAQAADRARTVLNDQSIAITETKTSDSGAHQEFHGKTADGQLDVEVDLDAQGDSSTNIEVSAKRNLVEWDKDYAQMLLKKIVGS